MNSAVVPTKVLSDPMELERTLQSMSSGLMQSAATAVAANATSSGGYPFDTVSMAAAAAAAANGGFVATTATTTMTTTAAVASEPAAPAAVSYQGR